MTTKICPVKNVTIIIGYDDDDVDDDDDECDIRTSSKACQSTARIKSDLERDMCSSWIFTA